MFRNGILGVSLSTRRSMATPIPRLMAKLIVANPQVLKSKIYSTIEVPIAVRAVAAP